MAKKHNRNPYFANSIKLLRMQYEMSQGEFALALGMAPASSRSKNLSAMISGWERGDREPSLEMVCRICRRFGVTSDWLLGLEDNSSAFGRQARLMLLRGEDNISDEDKVKLLKIIEAFTHGGDKQVSR